MIRLLVISACGWGRAFSVQSKAGIRTAWLASGLLCLI